MASVLAFSPSARQAGLIKGAVFVLALVPLLRMVYLTLTGQLVEPIEFITRATGDWTLYFLCFTLAVTPLRRLLKWNWLVKLRRMLGLYMFFYGCLHFLTFLWFDHFFDLREMWKDVLRRPFITVGFIAFVLLIPLALTSTNGMIKRLGGEALAMLRRTLGGYAIHPNFASVLMIGLGCETNDLTVAAQRFAYL